MKEYKYIIIGGGMTGSSAAMGIRQRDPAGSIAMFTKEPHGPYNRPPLSKSLWGKGKLEDIMRPLDPYRVDLYLETKVARVVCEKKQIVVNDGEKYAYTKLLLATGGAPIQFPNLPQGVIAYRTRADFEQLKAVAGQGKSIAVVGGGFIGSEIAAALTRNGCKVTMVFPEDGISARIFPANLSQFINDYYAQKGVTIKAHWLVNEITKEGNVYNVQIREVNTGEIENLTFDKVVLGIGVKPEVALAEQAGLEINNGIRVTPTLQTADPDIYAAGDVANFYNPSLQTWTRVEHEDNANAMGMMAGMNMAGEAQKYEHFPFFYSDLFDLGYEALGELSSDHNIIEDWIEPFKKGTIFYLNDPGQIRGIIFWNLWGKIDEGRKLIAEGKTHQPEDLKGLFK